MFIRMNCWIQYLISNFITLLFYDSQLLIAETRLFLIDVFRSIFCLQGHKKHNILEIWAVKFRTILFCKNMLKNIEAAPSECTAKE